MKFLLSFLLIFSFIQTTASQDSMNTTFIKSASKAKPSVIFITTYNTKDDAYHQSGYGTGTIISKSGFIVTNYHVVKDSTSFQAKLFDGSTTSFQRFRNGLYYVADPETDIAVMKLVSRKSSYAPIIFGNSTDLQEGEWVIAVGNPYGLSNSITSGIVSSTNRSDVGFTDIEDFIQTDVPINPGNSGGPLINLQGEMVGLNTAIRTVSGGYQGISFSIPSEIVYKVYIDLIKYGYVRRGWIGILVQEKESSKRGVRDIEIISILKQSPAEQIGLKEGDIILFADHKKIESKSQLLKIVKNKQIDTNLTFSIKRGKNIKSFSIAMREKKHYLKVGTILLSLKKIYGLELDQNSFDNSIIISNVSPLLIHTHSNLLRQGDIIKRVNGVHIDSLETFTQVFKKSHYSLQSMQIIRNDKSYLITIIENY